MPASIVPPFCWMYATVSSSFCRASRPACGFRVAALLFATRRVWSQGTFNVVSRTSFTMVGSSEYRTGLKVVEMSNIPESRKRSRMSE